MKEQTILKKTCLLSCIFILMFLVVGCKDCNLNSLLSGTYGVIDYSSVPWSGFTSISFDGEGGGTFEREYSSNSELPSGSFTYTVDPDGTFNSSVNGDPIYGMVSPDGSSFTMVHTAGNLGVTLGIKKSDNMSEADLIGTYGVIDYSSVPWSCFTSISFDGEGGGAFERVYSSNSDMSSGSFTYTVDADGMFNSSVNGDPVYGMVSPDGSSFTMVHTAGNLGVTLGIKKSVAMSEADLSGSYGVIDYSSVPWSGFTRISFDGEGGGTFEREYSSNSELPSGSFTYTVDADGMFNSADNGDPIYGMVSPDGSSFTMIHTAGNLGVTLGIKETK